MAQEVESLHRKYVDAAMFCFQCEQTDHGVACVKMGVCRKDPAVSSIQDLIVHGLGILGHHINTARQWEYPPAPLGQLIKDAAALVLESFFATLTNVNFDGESLLRYLRDLAQLIERAASISGKPTAVSPFPDGEALESVEGAVAYLDHVLVGGGEIDDATWNTMYELLAFTATPSAWNLGDALANCMKVGHFNLKVLEMLYNVNKKLGVPTPTKVPNVPRPGKCILISGHDLFVLESLLKAIEGTDISVYTHGEMLPAHGYPKLKAYPNLYGHFGGPWNRQKMEFPLFPGPIVMTTNCLMEPSDRYASRLFTLGPVAWPGIPNLGPAPVADWGAVIASATACEGFTDTPPRIPPWQGITRPDSYMVGFGHETVASVLTPVLEQVKAGNISRFFVIGGCDGTEGERSYFTELTKQLPDTALILTLGCGKFRVNPVDKGTVEALGIPRILDLGQCNETYSAVQIAIAAAQALGCGVGDLPLSIVLSWFEQKAVADLLTLVALGLKPIRIGPRLPGFVTPGVLEVLVRDHGIKLAGDPKQDVEDMMAGN